MLPRLVRSPLECSDGVNPIAHELARVGETPQVADLGDQTDGRDRGNAAKCLQCANYRLEAPARDRSHQRLGQAVGADSKLSQWLNFR
jgi:hypothetical protein